MLLPYILYVLFHVRSAVSEINNGQCAGLYIHMYKYLMHVNYLFATAFRVLRSRADTLVSKMSNPAALRATRLAGSRGAELCLARRPVSRSLAPPRFPPNARCAMRDATASADGHGAAEDAGA